MRRFSQLLGTMDDWGNLKFFIEFAARGSLFAAAQRLGVDHSTVARRIEALEQSLGVRLVVRLPRAYHLTAAGEHVLELARHVETSVGEITEPTTLVSCIRKATLQSSALADEVIE